MSDAETYTYIPCKTDFLRTSFGGNAIIAGTTGDNLLVSTITQRQTIKEIGTLVDKKTVELCRSGHLPNTTTSTILKVSNDLLPFLEPYLHPDEWANRTATNITDGGGSGNGVTVQYAINPNIVTVFIAGDSIDWGVGIKTPSSTENYILNFDAMEEFHYSRLAMEAVDTNVYSESFATTKIPTQTSGDAIFYGDKMMINRVAVGGASYNNTVGTVDQTDFIHRFGLKFNQIYRTINSNNKTVILIGFGTNDAAYDTSLTAAQLFAREEEWVKEFLKYHQNVKVIMATDIKRTNDSTLNNRIHALNQLRRENYLTIGASYLCDFEITHPDFNCLTGTISTGINGLYADNDLVHPSKLGHYYMKNQLIPIFKDILNITTPTLKRVHITNNIIKEHSSIGTYIGTIYNFQETGSTFTLINDASGRFSLSGSNLVVNADIEFSEGYKHDITIRETLIASGKTKDTVIPILIGNLAPVYPITRFPLDPALSVVASGRPQISGNPFSGSVLTGTNGTWINTVDSYAVQWKRDGVDFTSTTPYTYLLTDSDVGCGFTFQVIATNSNGSTTNISLEFTPGPVLATPSVTGNDVTITWTFFNDSGVTDYIIEYKLASSSKWLTLNDGVSTIKSATITGLVAGIYEIKVSAKRGTGSSAKYSKDSVTQTFVIS